MSNYEPNYKAPRPVRLSDKQEFTKEERRLDKRAPPKEKSQRKSFYEKLLDKGGY